MTTFSRTDARVLVVDDEAAIVRLLTRGLASAGYSQVTGMTESTRVLEYLDENTPDLVVLDLTMPGMDGFELIERISARLPDDFFLPVLVLSGLHDQKSKERAFQAGAKDYLTKPVELSEFLLHADSLLETRFMSQRLHEAQSAMEQVIGQQAEELVVTDTARHHAERLLRLTQFSVDRAADSVFWLDSEGKVLFVSEATCRALGYTKEELLGMTIYQVDPTPLGARYQRNWAKIKEQGTVRFETVHRTKDGQDFPVETTLNYLEFEGKEYNCVFARDIASRKRTEKQLEESLSRLRESQATIIQVLSQVTELRDPYTAGHQQRVAEICVAIGSRMVLAPEQIEGLEVAALLHDVGKVSIPLEVLSIPGKFSLLQRMLVEGHVAAGYEILRPIPLPWPVAQITLEHHERLDGSGYPNRLSGDQIMLEARILAVADTFEAMTTHRPYRGAVEAEAALKELRMGKGRLFDIAAVDTLCSLVEEGVIGPRVEPDLSDLSFLL
jgi:PAS domain S-box-containing protein